MPRYPHLWSVKDATTMQPNHSVCVSKACMLCMSHCQAEDHLLFTLNPNTVCNNRILECKWGSENLENHQTQLIHLEGRETEGGLVGGSALWQSW